MTRRIPASELQATILALLDEVADGAEVQITEHGRVVARLVPAVAPEAVQGRLVGVARSVADDEELVGTGERWGCG